MLPNHRSPGRREWTSRGAGWVQLSFIISQTAPLMRTLRTLTVLATLGCAESHSPGPLVPPRPVIELPGLTPGAVVFEVPATAAAGIPFAVTYATFGSSSCSKHLAPERVVGAATLRITPQLAAVAANTPCTDDIGTIRHTIMVSWPSRTEPLLLVLRGYRFDGSTVEVTRTVQVR